MKDLFNHKGPVVSAPIEKAVKEVKPKVTKVKPKEGTKTKQKETAKIKEPVKVKEEAKEV